MNLKISNIWQKLDCTDKQSELCKFLGFQNQFKVEDKQFIKYSSIIKKLLSNS